MKVNKTYNLNDLLVTRESLITVLQSPDMYLDAAGPSRKALDVQRLQHVEQRISDFFALEAQWNFVPDVNLVDKKQPCIVLNTDLLLAVAESWTAILTDQMGPGMKYGTSQRILLEQLVGSGYSDESIEYGVYTKQEVLTNVLRVVEKTQRMSLVKGLVELAADKAYVHLDQDELEGTIYVYAQDTTGGLMRLARDILPLVEDQKGGDELNTTTDKTTDTAKDKKKSKKDK